MLILKRVLAYIKNFLPSILILSLGYDLLQGDPTGNFTLSARDLYGVAREIARLIFIC